MEPRVVTPDNCRFNLVSSYLSFGVRDLRYSITSNCDHNPTHDTWSLSQACRCVSPWNKQSKALQVIEDSVFVIISLLFCLTRHVQPTLSLVRTETQGGPSLIKFKAFQMTPTERLIKISSRCNITVVMSIETYREQYYHYYGQKGVCLLSTYQILFLTAQSMILTSSLRLGVTTKASPSRYYTNIVFKTDAVHLMHWHLQPGASGSRLSEEKAACSHRPGMCVQMLIDQWII